MHVRNLLFTASFVLLVASIGAISAQASAGTSAGNTVLLNLDAVVQSGATALYVRYGAPPTLQTYDVRAAVPNSPDQELRILSPQQGTYYIGIYGTYLTAGSTGYTLSAKPNGLAIRGVTTNKVSNADSVTVCITGDNFTSDASVAIDGPGHTDAAAVWFADAATRYATFNLAGAAAGQAARSREASSLHRHGRRQTSPGKVSTDTCSQTA